MFQINIVEATPNSTTVYDDYITEYTSQLLWYHSLLQYERRFCTTYSMFDRQQNVHECSYYNTMRHLLPLYLEFESVQSYFHRQMVPRSLIRDLMRCMNAGA